jgi:hypothetical protein
MLLGLSCHLDQKTQTLYVKVPVNDLLPTVLQLNEGERPVGPRTIGSGTGVTLNYDIVGTFAGGHNGSSGSLNLIAFSPKGVISSGTRMGSACRTSQKGRTNRRAAEGVDEKSELDSIKRPAKWQNLAEDTSGFRQTVRRIDVLILRPDRIYYSDARQTLLVNMRQRTKRLSKKRRWVRRVRS